MFLFYILPLNGAVCGLAAFLIRHKVKYGDLLVMFVCLCLYILEAVLLSHFQFITGNLSG